MTGKQYRFPLVLLLVFLFAAPVFIPRAWAQDAALLLYGESAGGELGAGDSVFFDFEAANGDKPLIIVNATGGEIDPALRLYNPDGQLIGEDDDGNGKSNARLENIVLPEAGVYRVEVINAAPEGDGGEFGLIVNEEDQIITYHGNEAVLATGAENFQLSQPWPSNEVTYTILNTMDSFTEAEIREVIVEAFAAWTEDTPITFIEVSNPRDADIRIEFGRIDGGSNVLGQACPPSSPCAGDVLFDDAENWVLRETRRFNDISFLAVATHEFGHAIGLLHSDDPEALMYPQYSPYNLAPNTDDIRGVQRLYGRGRGAVQPEPGPGSGVSADGSQAVVTSEITDDSYIHFWDFDVTQGEFVTITMAETDGGLDPFIVILDANDNVLAFDDDSGVGRDAQVRNIRFPQTGTYTVAATRYGQLQGHTEGEYELSIQYGEVTGAPPDEDEGDSRGGATGGSSRGASAGDGSVRASDGDARDLERYPRLDSVITSPFIDSVSPIAQSRQGTVDADETYVFALTWCATDERTLEDAVEFLDVRFLISDDAVSSRSISEVITRENRLSCITYFVLLSDWEGDSLTLTAILSLEDVVFDGRNVYSAGDYIYNYNLDIR